MQPDLLSTQQEEEQLGSLNSQDLAQEARPYLMEGAVQPGSAPTAKKHSRWKLAAIGLVSLLFVLLLGLGWMGYWAYTLNAELTSSRQQLAALRSSHDQLQAEYTTLDSENEKLNVELSQSKTDLDKANVDLKSAQARLDASEAQNRGLNARIDTASDLAEILYAVATSEDDADILKIDRLVNAAGNDELTRHWEAFAESPSEDAFNTFFTFLLFATRESLSQTPPQVTIGAEPSFLDDWALAFK